jgi:hypothetical protein
VGSGNETGLSYEPPDIPFDDDDERYSWEDRRAACNAIEHFTDQFQALRGSEHPPINGISNLYRMCHVLDILAEGEELSSMETEQKVFLVIDAYFNKDYGAGCDYSFWHFTTDRVWGYLAVKLGLLYEEMYFDTDGQPNESIEY